MLMPRKIRHRKVQRGRMSGTAKGGTKINFGDYGIQALEPGWITNRQIEAARIAMTRYIKRGGKVWINIFPDKPVTQKPAETRMPRAGSRPMPRNGTAMPRGSASMARRAAAMSPSFWRCDEKFARTALAGCSSATEFVPGRFDAFVGFSTRTAAVI